MQVQCKACKSVLSVSVVNESQPLAQIRCRCGAIVSGATGIPVTMEEQRQEATTKVGSRTGAVASPSGSSSVSYVLGALPTTAEQQAESSSPFRLPEKRASSSPQALTSKHQAPELRLVQPETPSLATEGEHTPAASPPPLFRFVESPPQSNKEEPTAKAEQTSTLRFAPKPEEHESGVPTTQTTTAAVSSAPPKTLPRGNASAVAAGPVGSAPPHSKKRRPGAWRQCLEHPQVKSDMMCPTCAVGYCSECKKSICPTCDTPCIEASGYQKWLEQERIRNRPMMEEIKTILAYPLQDPVAFIVFALITGFFKFAALFSHRVLIFSTGILLWYSFHTLYQVASGNMKRLLPEFNDVSDLTHPIRLSGAALAITWGPVLLVGLLFTMNAETTGTNVSSMVAGAAGVPAETIAPPVNVDAQVQERVQSLLGGLGGEDTDSDEPSSAEDAPQQRSREAIAPKEPVAPPSASPVTSAIPFDTHNASTGLSLLLFLALFWKVAYTPVALIVAALSKNLLSVVNPLIGLDTIRRMGPVYWHVMIIYTGLTAAEWGLGKMFDLFPLVGLAGMAFVKAYIALAVGCALGLAVFKKAPELGWD